MLRLLLEEVYLTFSRTDVDRRWSGVWSAVFTIEGKPRMGETCLSSRGSQSCLFLMQMPVVDLKSIKEMHWLIDCMHPFPPLWQQLWGTQLRLLLDSVRNESSQNPSKSKVNWYGTSCMSCSFLPHPKFIFFLSYSVLYNPLHLFDSAGYPTLSSVKGEGEEGKKGEIWKGITQVPYQRSNLWIPLLFLLHSAVSFPFTSLFTSLSLYLSYQITNPLIYFSALHVRGVSSKFSAHLLPEAGVNEVTQQCKKICNFIKSLAFW